MPTPSWRRFGAGRRHPANLPVDSTDVPSQNHSSPWRVCSTRDEPAGGPLADALRAIFAEESVSALFMGENA